jgi:ribonucleotide reductase alpha subunit
MAAKLTGNALTTLEARYLRRDRNGRVSETPAELFRRVAGAVAAAEKKYGGPNAVAAAAERFEELLATSEELASERGSCPAFAGSSRQLSGGAPVRNATVSTIAPTCTQSLIAGVSSGIEPIFAFEYQHPVLCTVLPEVHPLCRHRLAAGVAIDPEVFVTAREVPPEWHVRMKAAFQKYVDNAVSKTINFPETATVEQVEEPFLLANEPGCKGLTVYRDKSRRSQVLNVCTGKCPLRIERGTIPVSLLRRPAAALRAGRSSERRDRRASMAVRVGP